MMFTRNFPCPFVLRLALTGVGVSYCGPLTAASESPAVELDPLIVYSATRSPEDIRLLPSSLTLLPLDHLVETQVTDLQTALESVPGVYAPTSGAAGGQTSVFMRGASSHQVLFMVDGVRMNSRSAAYFNFLGGADLAGLDRIEVLRGPQSTLYGSSAMGGVIFMETARGADNTTGVISAQVGSFDTFAGAMASAGSAQNIGFSGSLAYQKTANDRPRNDYEQWSWSGRLETQPLTDNLTIGMTFRGQNGDYQEPGSLTFPSDADVDSANHLLTAYGDLAVSDAFNTKLTYGWHQRTYGYATEFFSTNQRNTRQIVDWQNNWQASQQVEFVGGINIERAHYTIDDYRIDDRTNAVYFSGVARPVEDLVITAGLRYDDFKTFDSATTWRTGASWLLNNGATKLRATYGTGFSAPGPEDSFGVPQWGQLPNPNLEPEESDGWDIGIDQDFLNGNVRVELTYFQNTFTNLFDYEVINFDTFEGMIVNRERASSRGVELAARARLTDELGLTASYTHLEAKDDDTNEPLARRPKHVLDLDGNYRMTDQWFFGAGAHLVADRYDGGTQMDDYTTVRLYGSYRPVDDLTVKLRIENALDESYEEVVGYPARPVGVFGSAEWRF